jgi:hypothetical protein
MNENDYLTNVVNIKNCWQIGVTINYCLLNKFKDNKIQNWNMKVIRYNNYNKYMEDYYIGYCLYPYDNFQYLRYNLSKLSPWVNNDWLPFWGDLTISKSKLMKEIKDYWKIKLLNQLGMNECLKFKLLKKIEIKY